MQKAKKVAVQKGFVFIKAPVERVMSDGYFYQHTPKKFKAIKPLPSVLVVSFVGQHRYVETLGLAFSVLCGCHGLLRFFYGYRWIKN